MLKGITFMIVTNKIQVRYSESSNTNKACFFQEVGFVQQRDDMIFLIQYLMIFNIDYFVN